MFLGENVRPRFCFQLLIWLHVFQFSGKVVKLLSSSLRDTFFYENVRLFGVSSLLLSCLHTRFLDTLKSIVRFHLILFLLFLILSSWRSGACRFCLQLRTFGHCLFSVHFDCESVFSTYFKVETFAFVKIFGHWSV